MYCLQVFTSDGLVTPSIIFEVFSILPWGFYRTEKQWQRSKQANKNPANFLHFNFQFKYNYTITFLLLLSSLTPCVLFASFQNHDFLFFNYYCGVYTDVCIYNPTHMSIKHKYNLLSLSSIISTCMISQLITWYWITNYGAHSWGEIFLPFPKLLVADHLCLCIWVASVRFPSPILACLLVLYSFRSGLGSHAAEPSWV